MRLADHPGTTLIDRDTTRVLRGRAGRAPRSFAALKGRTVLLRATSQLIAADCTVQLDGLARRMVVAPPDLEGDKLLAVLDDAGVEAIVGDLPAVAGRTQVGIADDAADEPVDRAVDTEWLLLTSGTSGRPKLVGHRLAALCGPIAALPGLDGVQPFWATFYDLRRYGGLQILLRAILGGADLHVGSPGEEVGAQLRRFGAAGVNAISGTPSHWRNALIGAAANAIAPRYLRLSGEASDQVTLDAVQAAYPAAHVAHAYASTEAGVVFTVNDGRAGFPTSFAEDDGPVVLRVVNDTLQVSSPYAAQHYVGPDAPALRDAEGFIDTGDLVERRGDRYLFAGRRNGIINVGGLKVSPEEVEETLNAHPAVGRSLVRAKNNPLLGALVVADVLLRAGFTGDAELQAALQQHCRDRLQRHKVPALVRFVDDLPLTAAGKLSRRA